MNNNLNYNSVEIIPGVNAKAAFTTNTSTVFREERDICPITILNDKYYMPWGGDNQMPFNILRDIERDETLSTCQLFNAEVLYGAGLKYNCENAAPNVAMQVRDFFMDNDIPSYFLGVAQDFKHFGFAVSVVIMNADNTKIVSVIRKEAIYCRFAPKDKHGKIPYVIYANWRRPCLNEEDYEIIELLDPSAPWRDLQAKKKSKNHKFAILTKVPTVDSTYYPIPHYAALFKGNWFNIKQIIGMAKEAKLRNSAPIKYHIEISAKYYESIFKAEGVTDRAKRQQRIVEEKQKILDFLTGAENSGKAWFSTFYVTPDGKENHDVVIHKVESAKEGGDWETDIQEAINMICFTLRVHSNLVGSVPGKSQSNNSGSDKRELYTIAQSLQKPYRDIFFKVHEIIIRFNGWMNVFPECPLIQLTTLDEHKDAKEVTI